MNNPIENHTRKPVDWSKYLVTFIITAIIFALTLYLGNILNGSKITDLRSVQDSIALNILSSETQYDLLRETSCKNVNDGILSSELNDLERKLSYMESGDPTKNGSQLEYVKKYYELLEIKDYLLMKRLSEKCGFKPISILYFYGTKEDCPDCDKTSVVLNYLRSQYPNIRIYSFDQRLSVSAVDTFSKVYKIQPPYPILVINEEVYKGFKSIDEMKNIIPELKKMDREKAALEAKNSSSTNSNTKSPATSSTSTSTR